MKKGINAILFGMSFQKWKHLNSISNEKRTLSIEKVEREVAKARSLIVDRELRNGKAYPKEKEARVLSRAAERICCCFSSGVPLQKLSCVFYSGNSS